MTESRTSLTFFFDLVGSSDIDCKVTRFTISNNLNKQAITVLISIIVVSKKYSRWSTTVTRFTKGG